MPIFDRTQIPRDVFRPEALDHLDHLVDRLRGLRLEELSVRDPHNQFRPPGMARALSQSYVWRCVELAEATAALCNLGHWLSAIANARTILETIAAYDHLAGKLGSIVDEGNVEAIHDFLHAACFQTRIPKFIEESGDNVVKATNVLTQIDALAKKSEGSIREDYDHLCDFAHPNSLGTFLFFGKHNDETDVVAFCGKGWIPAEAFRWVGCMFSNLDVALSAAEEIEGLAQRISELGDG